MTDPALEALPARVTAAMRGRWAGAQLGPLEPLPGGISSLTFAAAVMGMGPAVPGTGPAVPGMGPEERRVVVKVAPPGLEPVRNRDVLRQARVIAAVHDAPGVLVPEVLASDAGAPPFFVMEFVPGQAFEPKWDLSAAPPAPAVVEARARAAARMLARLQAIEPAAVGVTDAPLTLAEEAQRWGALFATVGDDLRANETELRDALTGRLPTPAAARILHGDYRLGNIQFDGERPAAIIDWEIWSVGDPRMDVAWLMAFADPVQQRVAHRDAANQAAADAMPPAGELLAAYMEAADIAQAPAELDWFRAFAYYKLGAAMSVLCKRNRRLAEPDPGLELAARTLAPMLDRGLELLA